MGQTVFPAASGFDWSVKTPTYARVITSNAALQTVIEVTGGPGVASVGIQSAADADRQARGLITVDGVALDDQSGATLAGAYSRGIMVYGGGGSGAGIIAAIGNYGLVGSAAYEGLLRGLIGFKSSFKFEVSTSSAANIIGVAVVHS